jgi:hypothetical protein
MLREWLDIKKDSAKEFWVGHAIVLMATVIAVYLAASAGFAQAVKFELVKANMDSFHLRNSMLDELTDNITYMDTIGKEYLGGKSAKYSGKKGQFGLQQFVWEGMKFSPVTFETPSDILTPIRRYYALSSHAIDKMTDRQPTVMTRKLVKEAMEEGERLKRELIPKIKANIEALRVDLKNYNIDL